MQILSTGEAIVSSLIQHDVDTVFECPGHIRTTFAMPSRAKIAKSTLSRPAMSKELVIWPLAMPSRPVGLVFIQ